MDWDIKTDVLSNIVDMYGDLMGRDVMGVTAASYSRNKGLVFIVIVKMEL